jgi:hypothetical protein
MTTNPCSYANAYAADKIITTNIDAYVEAECGRKDDDDGTTGDGNRNRMTSLEVRFPGLVADLRERRSWSSGECLRRLGSGQLQLATHFHKREAEQVQSRPVSGGFGMLIVCGQPAAPDLVERGGLDEDRAAGAGQEVP